MGFKDFKDGSVKPSGIYDGVLKYRNIKTKRGGYYLHNAEKVVNYDIEDQMNYMLMDRVKVRITDKSTGSLLFNKSGVLLKKKVQNEYNFFVDNVDLGNILSNSIGKDIHLEIRTTKVCLDIEDDNLQSLLNGGIRDER